MPLYGGSKPESNFHVYNSTEVMRSKPTLWIISLLMLIEAVQPLRLTSLKKIVDVNGRNKEKQADRGNWHKHGKDMQTAPKRNFEPFLPQGNCVKH